MRRRKAAVVGMVALLSALLPTAAPGVTVTEPAAPAVTAAVQASKRTPEALTPVQASRFMFTVGGRPVRWDSCAPVTLRVIGAPDDVSAKQIVLSLRNISNRTGLSFRFTRPGERAALTIKWVPGRADRDWAGKTFVTTTGGTPDRLESAVVLIDADWWAATPVGWGEGDHQGVLLLHELGHAVGVGHDPDMSSVMYGGEESIAMDFTDRDTAALRAVGRQQGECPRIAPQAVNLLARLAPTSPS